MDYLSRDGAPIKKDFWKQIDSIVVETARNHLNGRKFLTVYGPLGSGAINVSYDKMVRNEEFENGIVKTTGRTFVELPQIYADFSILWRDIENHFSTGLPLDLTAVIEATHKITNLEDSLIFFGNKFLKTDGIMNAPGVQKVAISDWKEGENAFMDIVKGVNMIISKGLIGHFFLCVSPELYVNLQRIQTGTGLLEVDRIAKQLGGLFRVPILKGQQAVLICSEPQYIDLAIGQDIVTAYLEQKDLNHSFRIIETVLPRIKKPEAIVVFEK